MKKAVFLTLVLSLALMSFNDVSDKRQSKKEKPKKEVRSNSLRCIIERTFLDGGSEDGCGGGANVCCANVNLKFS